MLIAIPAGLLVIIGILNVVLVMSNYEDKYYNPTAALIAYVISFLQIWAGGYILFGIP